MAEQQPDIQLIANLVVEDDVGRILFVRYHADDERWWLPGEDLEPYEHPDERAQAILDGFPGLDVSAVDLHHLESFRGRRGWHVIFTYSVKANGDPDGDVPARWFPADGLPRTVHGHWERERVQQVLG